MSQTPPAGQDREYTLQEAAELCSREYGYCCSTARELGLGHDEPRRPGSKGPLRRLLWAEEVETLRKHFSGKENGPSMETKGPRKYLKIKRTKREKSMEILIRWDERTSTGYETKTVECEEEPRPEFYEALASLVSQVPVLIEVPEEYQVGLTVNGITYAYDEYGERSVSIQALKELDGLSSPLVLNVPAAYAPANTPLGELVDALEAEADLYVAHHRAQLEMRFEEEREEVLV